MAIPVVSNKIILQHLYKYIYIYNLQKNKQKVDLDPRKDNFSAHLTLGPYLACARIFHGRAKRIRQIRHLDLWIPMIPFPCNLGDTNTI